MPPPEEAALKLFEPSGRLSTQALIAILTRPGGKKPLPNAQAQQLAASFTTGDDGLLAVAEVAKALVTAVALAKTKDVVDNFGADTDEQLLAWYLQGVAGEPTFNAEHMLPKAMARTGISLDDIWAGHPIAYKLYKGLPLAISVGCDAPDGPIFELSGEATTLHAKLQSLGAPQLTLLMFGSQTCPVFVGKMGSLLGVAQPYIDAGKIKVLGVYIREAHPEDGWSFPGGPFAGVYQPKTLPDRLALAAKHLEKRGVELAGVPFVVDDPTTNAIDLAYDAPPSRFMLLDAVRKVVWTSGQGPNQYHIEGMAAFLRSQFP